MAPLLRLQAPIFHLAHTLLDNVQPRPFLEQPVHRVLHSCAFGILESSQSYMALRRLNYNSDCNVIARTIFERAVKSMLATRGIEVAARILLTEFTEQRRQLHEWSHQSPGDQELIATAARELDGKIAALQAKFTPGQPFNSFIEMASELGLEGIYRQFYFNVSQFTHGTGWSTWRTGSEVLPGSDMMVLSSVVSATAAFYMVSDQAQAQPDMVATYMDRFEQLKRALAKYNVAPA